MLNARHPVCDLLNEIVSIEYIDSLDDPRVIAYCGLKGRVLERQGKRFIAEGVHLTRRLLASNYPVESVLVARRKLDSIGELVPEQVPLYIADDLLINQILGFEFHAGVVACGLRKPTPTLEQIVPADNSDEEVILFACPEINNLQNLGALIRVCAGLGAQGVLLGERCCDPLRRQALRVSMGAVFNLPIRQSADLQDDLERLRDERGFEIVATVLDTHAQALAQAQRSRHMVLLFGSESQGLPEPLVELSNRQVTIPMHLGTDSLNVAVSAALMLYHFSMNPANEG